MNISGQCRTFTLWYSRNFTCIKDSNTTSVTELKLDNLYIIHCQLKNNLRHNKKKKKEIMRMWTQRRKRTSAALSQAYILVCVHSGLFPLGICGFCLPPPSGNLTQLDHPFDFSFIELLSCWMPTLTICYTYINMQSWTLMRTFCWIHT